MITDCPALPKGWKREEILRKSGISKIDVHYYSPSGKKFRTKTQMAKYFGDTVDLTSFDYRTGEINSLLLRKGKRQKNTSFEGIRGFRGTELSLIPPIRRTVSIFKQPVTILKAGLKDKVFQDARHESTDKPKQVFWEKRLENLRCTNIDQESYESFELPKRMKAVGPNVCADTVIRSISTALHLHSQSVTGQTASRADLEKNCSIFLNTDQPLVGALSITDEDIKKQEERVIMARKRLEEAINELEA